MIGIEEEEEIKVKLGVEKEEGLGSGVERGLILIWENNIIIAKNADTHTHTHKNKSSY